MIDDRMLEDDLMMPIEEPRGAPTFQRQPQSLDPTQFGGGMQKL